MTPSLAAVHDDLVAAAARHEEQVRAIRARFEARVGPFTSTDPWFEERTAALWDRVLCDAEVRAAIAAARPASFTPEHDAVLAALSRAQRGLYEVHAHGAEVDLLCVVRGAAFRMANSDDASRAMTLGGEGEAHAGWIDGVVLPTPEGVALLPGFLVHPAEATDPMRELRATELPFDELLDAFLAMRHRLAARSRMRARQVYRADALAIPRAP